MIEMSYDSCLENTSISRNLLTFFLFLHPVGRLLCCCYHSSSCHGTLYNFNPSLRNGLIHCGQHIRHVQIFWLAFSCCICNCCNVLLFICCHFEIPAINRISILLVNDDIDLSLYKNDFDKT